MVNAVAEATQTDPAMSATSALSALSTGTGGHAVIDLRSGWREPLNLYTVAIAEPGERKSAVQQSMVSPIYAAEASLAAANRAERIEAETEKQIAERAADRLRIAASKEDDPQHATTALSTANLAALFAESLEVPPIPRLVADNITPEKAASLLCEQGGRLAIITTEGGIYDIIAGRYSKSNLPDLDIWLKGHSGDWLKVDRIGREPEDIPHPAITLALMIQPQVLSAIAARQDFRGRGPLARFLYARPISNVGHRRIGTPVGPETEAAYHDTVKDLAIGMAAWGGDNRAVLTLTADARREFERIEAGRRASPCPDRRTGCAGRLGIQVRRSRCPHRRDPAPGPARRSTGASSSVGLETIRAAEKIGEYFKASAVNVFAEMDSDPTSNNATYLWDRIASLGQDVVTERDMLRAAQRFTTRADLMPVVGRLVENGWLIKLPAPRSTGGRPPSTAYQVVNESQEGRSRIDSSVSSVAVMPTFTRKRTSPSSQPRYRITFTLIPA